MTQHKKSKDFPDCFYRVTVKALVVKDGKILLIKESPKVSGKWELPGGGLEFGEKPHDGLRREIAEELKLRVKSISDRPVYVWPWRFDNDDGMDWYYSMVIAFKVELEDYNFSPTEECDEIRFSGKAELDSLDLCWQTNGLKEYFDPEDFK